MKHAIEGLADEYVKKQYNMVPFWFALFCFVSMQVLSSCVLISPCKL